MSSPIQSSHCLQTLTVYHRTDDFIIASISQNTLLFHLQDNNTICRLDPSPTGFITGEPTIAVSNLRKRIPPKPGQSSSKYMDSSFVVQVTPSAVTVLEYDISLDVHTRIAQPWKPDAEPGGKPRSILAADVNPSQIVVALSGRTLALLNLDEEGNVQFA